MRFFNRLCHIPLLLGPAPRQQSRGVFDRIPKSISPLLAQQRQIDVLAADRLVRVNRDGVCALVQRLLQRGGHRVHLVVADVVLRAENLLPVHKDLGVFVIRDYDRGGV